MCVCVCVCFLHLRIYHTCTNLKFSPGMTALRRTECGMVLQRGEEEEEPGDLLMCVQGLARHYTAHVVRCVGIWGGAFPPDRKGTMTVTMTQRVER